MTRTLWTLIVASACVGGTEPTLPVPADDTGDTGSDEIWSLQEHVDAGEVCLGVDDAGDLVAMVRIQDCMSSSCSRAYVGSCSLQFDGTGVTLQSDISWEDNVSPQASCTEDCGIPFAECSLTGLPAGTYDVAFGAQTLSLVWPLTEPCTLF